MICPDSEFRHTQPIIDGIVNNQQFIAQGRIDAPCCRMVVICAEIARRESIVRSLRDRFCAATRFRSAERRWTRSCRWRSAMPASKDFWGVA
jgi:hypothetical protein